MDSGKLLWATGVSHLRRERQRNRLTTRRQTGILVRPFPRGDVVWTDNVEKNGERKTAVGYWRQSPEARKAEKIK